MATFADEAVDRDPWIGFWICDRDSGLVIGSGGFKGKPDENGVEIGYGISPDWQSQGVATALVTRMVEFAFEHGLKRVFAHTLPSGHASQKVLGKNGFSLVGPTYVEEDGDVLLFEKVHLG